MRFVGVLFLQQQLERGRRLEAADAASASECDHFLDALGLERGHRLRDVAIDREHRRRLRGHAAASRPACRTAPWLSLRELADRADVARDFEQALLLRGA